MSGYRPPFIKQLFHQARRQLAKSYLSFQPALQIAITGSQGKTNTTYIISTLLKSLGNTVVTDLNLDTVYNVPITALKVTPFTKYVVFELGVDQLNDMNQYLEIVKPNIAIITGISPVHTDKDHLGSLEELIREKRKLIEVLPKNGFAILNWDDENVRNMSSYTKANILWYGSDKNHCDIWINKQSVKVSLKGTEFNLADRLVLTKLIGKHQPYNIMAAYLTIKAIEKLTNQSFPVNQLTGIISKIKPLAHRMSLEKGPKEIIVLDDSRRANPASTASGLQTFSEIEYNGRKIAILAEMGELQNPEFEHREIGKLITKLKINLLIAIGPYQKYTADTAIALGMNKDDIHWFTNIIEAGNFLKINIKKSDFLYLKGSHLRHLERILLILNDITVGCSVVSCPFYWECKNCQYLVVGYQNVT